jgi:hypothetical protein
MFLKYQDVQDGKYKNIQEGRKSIEKTNELNKLKENQEEKKNEYQDDFKFQNMNNSFLEMDLYEHTILLMRNQISTLQEKVQTNEKRLEAVEEIILKKESVLLSEECVSIFISGLFLFLQNNMNYDAHFFNKKFSKIKRILKLKTSDLKISMLEYLTEIKFMPFECLENLCLYFKNCLSYKNIKFQYVEPIIDTFNQTFNFENIKKLEIVSDVKLNGDDLLYLENILIFMAEIDYKEEKDLDSKSDSVFYKLKDGYYDWGRENNTYDDIKRRKYF